MYCEQVDAVYQIIDPGYQKERGTIIRALCEVSKLLAKKYLNEKKETEEQFSERVKKCIDLFQEGQKCMFVRLKKDPNDVSKFLVKHANEGPKGESEHLLGLNRPTQT